MKKCRLNSTQNMLRFIISTAGALRFTAAKGDHVAVPYSPDFELNDFSVCAWVRLLPRCDTMRLSAALHYQLQLSSGLLFLFQLRNVDRRTRETGPADVLGGVLGTRFGPGASNVRIANIWLVISANSTRVVLIETGRSLCRTTILPPLTSR
eukprot:SAG11_NODE_3461_length_2434_cov_1.295931_2_plen_152_part_00